MTEKDATAFVGFMFVLVGTHLARGAASSPAGHVPLSTVTSHLNFESDDAAASVTAQSTLIVFT